MEDEQLINAIRCTSHGTSGDESILWLLDARPKANAYANAAMGAGFEATSAYTNCSIEFLNILLSFIQSTTLSCCFIFDSVVYIGNIHVMRDCYNKLETMVHSAWEGDVPKWFSMLEMTHWLDRIIHNSFNLKFSLTKIYIKLLLYGTAKLVDLLDVAGQPVVVHCSDGWDRTAQVRHQKKKEKKPIFLTTFISFVVWHKCVWIPTTEPLEVWRC